MDYESYGESGVTGTLLENKQSVPWGRAWIELDGAALRFNVASLESLIPETCELMPAVKAEAYGHGAVLISRELNQIGVQAFCVATVAEGVELRKNKIKGEILVLGYTHPDDFRLLHQYHLTQTAIDYEYACLLNEYGKNLRVHIGVDTGMHRIGERCENIEEILQIYEMENLTVEGIFTHLSADDVMEPKDIEFTQAQIQNFYKIVDKLEAEGYPRPKLHLQSSYGMLNYPDVAEDYARVGIALYGTLSTREDTENCKIPLRPVLSLKSRVTTVRTVYPGEAVGYGMQFQVDHEMRIASLGIGYADGYPRGLSNGVGEVLIKGYRVPIIGRICMDQTIVDITNAPDVVAGDIAVLIGKSGEEEITVGDIAEQTGTITNEVLSRMGSRLERMWI